MQAVHHPGSCRVTSYPDASVLPLEAEKISCQRDVLRPSSRIYSNLLSRHRCFFHQHLMYRTVTAHIGHIRYELTNILTIFTEVGGLLDRCTEFRTIRNNNGMFILLIIGDD